MAPTQGCEENIHLVSRPSRAREQLRAVAAALLERRDAILEAWRAAGELGTERSVASSLSRVQFNDHIPSVLDCLAHTIRAWPDAQTAAAAEDQSADVCEHGLQRWQQGYPLRELIRPFAARGCSCAPTASPTARRSTGVSIRPSRPGM
jgi:AcrR family transcriptional regulator